MQFMYMHVGFHMSLISCALCMYDVVCVYRLCSNVCVYAHGVIKFNVSYLYIYIYIGMAYMLVYVYEC